jgi:hypothetical protein
MDRYLHFTWLLVLPLGLLAGAAIEHLDHRTARAREQLKAPVNLDKFDRLAARMLADDQFAELDQAWCSERGIAWPVETRTAALPARPARHGSPHRLHRGF